MKHRSAQKSSQPATFIKKNRYQRVKTSHDGQIKNEPIFLSKNHESFNKKNKLELRKDTKAPQQIIQQNLNLKSFINSLQQQLVLQRSRLQVSKKKNLKFTKQLNRQFEKQMYYSGKSPNSYMISGIKQQYQNMKALYEDKCIQIETLYRSIESTQIQELKVHIQALYEQNIFLKNNLQTYMSIREQYQYSYQKPRPSFDYQKQQKQNGRLYSQPSQDKSEVSNKNSQILAYILAEEKENLKKSQQKVYYQSKKLQALARRQNQLINKIQFLQKLIIQKDNNQHMARRQFKKIEKEKLELQNEIYKKEELLESIEQLYKNKLKRLQQSQKKKFQVEKEIFMNSINEKMSQIAKLQKQIRFLSTMLSYWKPLDEINRQFKRQSEKDYSQSEAKKQGASIEKEDRLSNSVRFRVNSEHVRESQYLKSQYTHKLNQQHEKSLRINKQEQSIIKRTITDNRSSQNALISVREKLQRPRRDCSKKRSENAKKVRKVDLNDIKTTGQLIRFKLLGHKINIETVKSYLSGTNTQLYDEQIFEPYITMKEIKDIFLKFPFQLSDNDATLVSRYLVQDSNNEYVYWDEDNQIDRSIAKSILKAYIGDYFLPKKQDIDAEWQKIRKVYLPNIMLALKQIAPKGMVALSKFNQLIVGLGIEMTDALKDWIVGELVIKSNSLQELKYDAILNI